MRVVQLNCVFAQGSTGKIVAAIHEYLKARGDESYVLYGLGPKASDQRVFRIVPPAVRKAQSLRSRLTGFPYAGALWGTARTLHELKRLQPDVVHVHCFNAYIVNIYRVLGYLKEAGIPTVITNHAEFMYTGGCTHALACEKWLTGCGECGRLGKEHPISWFFDRTADEWSRLRATYDGFDRLVVCCVSNWVRNRAKKSPFFRGKDVVTVLNGLDTSMFRRRFNPVLRDSFVANPNQKIVIHVTPGFGSPIKGGSHVLEMARRFPEVVFVIVGNRDGVETDLANVKFAGHAENQQRLAEYYSIADVCLLTSVKETFSMVTAESLCCGTPVVGFEAGGPESIALSEYSEFVPQGDDDALEFALRGMLERRVDSDRLSREAQSVYSQEEMCTRYRAIYEEVCAKSDNNVAKGGKTCL